MDVQRLLRRQMAHRGLVPAFPSSKSSAHGPAQLRLLRQHIAVDRILVDWLSLQQHARGIVEHLRRPPTTTGT